MVHVAKSVGVVAQDLAEEQGLDPVALERAQHGVVVGDELLAVDGPLEVELLQVWAVTCSSSGPGRCITTRFRLP